MALPTEYLEVRVQAMVDSGIGALLTAERLHNLH